MFTYRSYDDLHRDVRDWLLHAPSFAAVAGIPRSGILAAAIVAQVRNIPLLEIGDLDDPFRPDWARRLDRVDGPLLIVDDTSWTGRTIRAWRQLARPWIAWVKPTAVLQFAAVYGGRKALADLDLYGYRLQTGNHCFAWNLGRDLISRRIATDMDGVLCHDPPRQSDRLLAPAKFETIITGRPERHRPRTMEWLRAHGVDHKRLVMLPDGEPAAHVARFKASVYRRFHDRGDVVAYVESDHRQAREIADRTRLPVVSYGRQVGFHCTPVVPSWSKQ